MGTAIAAPSGSNIGGRRSTAWKWARLLGGAAVLAVLVWRLGAADTALTAEWFTGWVGAACDQRPELTAAAAGYQRRRGAEAAAGRVGVTVHHHDLLARPR
ncbi:MAG TPA: hypothetical protein VII33_14835 [Nakamurella sp.]